MYRLGSTLFAALPALVLVFGLAGVQAAEIRKITGPHTHQNLSIYFVHGTSESGPVPLTLAEALANNSVEVKETGSVQSLTIENRGDREVFVQMGTIVKGGRQDRVLTRSLMLPPRSGPVALAAYCVESGRWSRRGGEDSHRFASASRMLPSKAARYALAAPPNYGTAQALQGSGQSVTRSGEQQRGVDNGSPSGITALPPALSNRRAASRRRSARRRAYSRRRSSRQGEIWSNVANTQRKLSRALGEKVAAASSPSSLQLALENKKLNKRIDGFVGALTAKAGGDDIVGYVFAVNGRISSADVYPSNGLFKKMWPKLLKAAATEAIGESTKAAGKAPPTETVSAFLKDAEQGKIEQELNIDEFRLETRSAKSGIFNATRRAKRRSKGGFVHFNFVAH